MVELIEILATIELFSNEHYRKTPFKSGYRPLFNFPGAATKISGSIKLMGIESFAPGSKGDVTITYIKGIINDDYWKPGVKFSFDEGLGILGKGEIKEVIK
jgi:translation elongation factor EF-Tu-like GTPase